VNESGRPSTHLVKERPGSAPFAPVPSSAINVRSSAGSVPRTPLGRGDFPLRARQADQSGQVPEFTREGSYPLAVWPGHDEVAKQVEQLLVESR